MGSLSVHLWAAMVKQQGARLVGRQTWVWFGLGSPFLFQSCNLWMLFCDFTPYNLWNVKMAHTTAHLNAESFWWHLQCGVKSPFLNTSWDLSPCQYLNGEKENKPKNKNFLYIYAHVGPWLTACLRNTMDCNPGSYYIKPLVEAGWGTRVHTCADSPLPISSLRASTC